MAQSPASNYDFRRIFDAVCDHPNLLWGLSVVCLRHSLSQEHPMRLLEIKSNGGFSLVEYIDNIPHYAILSHTWLASGDEVTFHDLQSGGGKDKKGYDKLKFCARQAAIDHLRYFWVDTCCIDKRSSAELQEAINSMFRWYRGSTKCYVYLTDVSTNVSTTSKHHIPQEPRWKSDFETSRWFTRGWTLQELIAPRSVEFFSVEGHRIGDKISLIRDMNRITGISTRALYGDPLSQFDIYERFSWATRRQTTRAEDMAYSLLGIFGVFLPLIYGEGEEEATRRLREEISNAQSRSKRPRDIGAKSEGLHDAKRPKNERMEQTVSTERTNNIMKSLRFEQMETRHRTIKRTHAETCKWFLETPEYLAWLDNSAHTNRFFHLRGKPGCGKSTLMKFLLRHTQDMMKEDVFLSFFFNARGTDLEKSTVGTYQTLLVQLLDLFPFLSSIFQLPQFSMIEVDDTAVRTWDLETLQELLLEASQNLKDTSVMCFIDALDECEEQQIRDMVSFLEDLSDCASEHGSRIRICFASRYYPNVSIRTRLKMDLDKHGGHKEDIKTYLTSKLYIENQVLANDIHQRLLERASGVFLWIVLVVPMLKKVCDTGHSFEIQKKISEVPNDVHELFRNIITRDSSNRRELALCIQWVLFAQRPLNAIELYVAIRSTTENGSPARFEFDLSDVEDMERYILDISKGLTEKTKADIPVIQFIHESVRDFLLKKDGLTELCPELSDNPGGRTHEHLKDFCYTYMRTADMLDLMSDCTKEFPNIKSDEFWKLYERFFEDFPLLRYALEYVLHHADDAAASGISQKAFLQNFAPQELTPWLKYDDTPVQVSFFDKKSLHYIMAEDNLVNLMETFHTDSKTSYLPMGKDDFGCPILVAHAKDNAAAAQFILQAMATESGVENRVSLEWRRRFEDGSWRGDFSTLGRVSDRRPLLSYFAEFGHDDVFALVLETGFLDMEESDESCQSPLWHACKKGREKIIRLLLEKGAKFISQHRSGCKSRHMTRGALHAAAEAGHLHIVQLLLDRGANVDGVEDRELPFTTPTGQDGDGNKPLLIVENDSFKRTVNSQNAHAQQNGTAEPDQDKIFDTPLSLASVEGHSKVVRLLIDNGADVNSHGGIAVRRALENGHMQIRRLFIESGAVVAKNLELSYASGALPKASQRGSLQDVQELLNIGVDINKQNEQQYSALAIASEGGYKEIVQLLLEKGVDVNAQGAHGTALQRASLRGMKGIVEMLLSTGAEINAQCGSMNTALEAASYGGHKETVALLLSRGAEVNLQGSDPENKTGGPLQGAARNGRKEIVELLLAHGADINLEGGQYGTALQAAAWDDDREIVNVLLSHGADVNIQGGLFNTALQAASRYGHKELVELLLSKGADVNPQGGPYSMAIAAAMSRRNGLTKVMNPAGIKLYNQVIQLLKDHGGVPPPESTS